jgi:hypothetical protein
VLLREAARLLGPPVTGARQRRKRHVGDNASLKAVSRLGYPRTVIDQRPFLAQLGRAKASLA